MKTPGAIKGRTLLIEQAEMRLPGTALLTMAHDFIQGERAKAARIELIEQRGFVTRTLPADRIAQAFLPSFLRRAKPRIPERATAVDPEPKPPEATWQADDGAGSSSEAESRLSHPAVGGRSRARGEDDGQTLASAAGAGGSPVLIAQAYRPGRLWRARAQLQDDRRPLWLALLVPIWAGIGALVLWVATW